MNRREDITINTNELQKILVVDDSKTNIRILVNALKTEFDISISTDGPGALEIARSNAPPKLILMDIQMPEMDGYEVCRQLKSASDTKDIPVIFLTSKANKEDEALGLKLGAVDYIRKPYNIDIVVARVKTHLELYEYRKYLNEQVEEKTKSLLRVINTLKKEINFRKAAEAREIKARKEAEERLVIIERQRRELEMAIAVKDEFIKALNT